MKKDFNPENILEEINRLIDKPIIVKNYCCAKNFRLKPKTSTNKARVKKGIVNGEKFDSKWEYAYYIYNKNILHKMIQRNQKEFLFYVKPDGKKCKFIPDFKVGNTYHEIKGVHRPNDVYKKQQHPEVVWITGVEMKPILDKLNKEYPEWEKEYLSK